MDDKKKVKLGSMYGTFEGPGVHQFDTKLGKVSIPLPWYHGSSVSTKYHDMCDFIISNGYDWIIPGLNGFNDIGEAMLFASGELQTNELFVKPYDRVSYVFVKYNEDSEMGVFIYDPATETLNSVGSLYNQSKYNCRFTKTNMDYMINNYIKRNEDNSKEAPLLIPGNIQSTQTFVVNRDVPFTGYGGGVVGSIDEGFIKEEVSKYPKTLGVGTGQMQKLAGSPDIGTTEKPKAQPGTKHVMIFNQAKFNKFVDETESKDRNEFSNFKREWLLNPMYTLGQLNDKMQCEYNMTEYSESNKSTETKSDCTLPPVHSFKRSISEEELSEVENMMCRFIDDNKYDWMIPFGTAFVSLDAFKKYYDGFPGVHYGCVFYPAGFFDVYLHDARKNRLNPQFVPIGRILPQSEYDERFTEENVEEMVQRYLDTDYKALYEETLEELRKVQKVNADLILKVMSLEDKHEARMNRKVIRRYGITIEK